MAGSFNHVINKKGALRKPSFLLEALDARGWGDVYEAIEEMYGMIWVLAEQLQDQNVGSAESCIEEAQKNYKVGLVSSPTDRFTIKKLYPRMVGPVTIESINLVHEPVHPSMIITNYGLPTSAAISSSAPADATSSSRKEDPHG